MRCDAMRWSLIVGIPDVQQIVITPTCKLLSTRGPLETTHFLIVTSQDSSDVLSLPAVQAAESKL